MGRPVSHAVRLALFVMIQACMLACSSPPSNDQSASAQGNTSAGTEDQERVAYAAAKVFLSEIDAGRFEETWANAGPALKATSNAEAWTAILHVTRSALGEAKDRKIKGFGFTDHLANAPPGEYAAIGFETTFVNATVEEKVVFQKDQGQWKVVGYFISKQFKAQL
ncbi:DUF4019 domain-containing protein [Dyella psychrodurans]|nr:DUF4019 domain-containing protein [Dyella psychrodurans]